MTKGKQRISCYISDELYTRLVQSECNITEAVIKGLEYVLKPAEDDNSSAQRKIDPADTSVNDNLIKSLEDRARDLNARIESLEEQLKVKDRHIETLNKELEKAPDPIELAQMKTKSDDLEKHNQTLNRELEKAHQDKETIQSLYDNYMRQMQTLIQQKAIEAPGEKKSRFGSFGKQ